MPLQSLSRDGAQQVAPLRCRVLAVVEVLVEGLVDGFVPVLGAAGVGEFVLGELDGLEESLGEVGEGGSGFGFYVAADDGGEEVAEGDAEVALRGSG